MTTRGGGLIVAMLAVSGLVAPATATDDNKACELLNASEIASVLGANVALKGGAMPGRTHICTGQASDKRIMLRLVAGLDPARDRSGSKEKAGLEIVKQMGGQVEVKTFGPIVCSALEPPAGKEQMGYNTTCTVSKDTAMACIEVTANTKQALIPIERLRPLAEKVMGRF
jgi:hypothetical protein